MSPKSRGRRPKSKPATRRPREDPLDDALLVRTIRDVGRDLAAISDPLEVELCASALLGTWWHLFLVDADPEIVLGERLVAVAARKRTTDALALLRVIAVLGTDRQRAAAAHGADGLAAKGVAEPAWAAELGCRVTSAWAYGDIYGDQTSVLLTVERAGTAHGLVVLVDHTLGGLAKDAFVTAEPVGTLRDIRSLAEPTVWIRELTTTEAAALLVPAFAVTDGATDPPVNEDFREFRALAAARLRLLPDVPRNAKPPVGPAQRDGLVAEFMASGPARELLDAGLDAQAVAGCARLVVAHACATDGDPLRVGPAKTEVLLGWLSEHELDEAQWVAVPSVVRAWVSWAGRNAGLPAQAQEALDEIVEDMTASLAEGDRDLDDDGLPPGLAEAVLDGLLEDAVTPEQVQETVTRRVFAIPYTTAVVHGEELVLDPRDADERGLLIRAEHPQHADAFDDPTFDADAAGVSPRLHIALHEIVANQLWDGDPPGVWPAAQRLLATGMERHDVLHALAEVATRHVHASLTQQKPDDAIGYAADLAALGIPVRRRRGPDPAQPGLFDKPPPTPVIPLRPATPARAAAGKQGAYRLKVTLRRVKPPVWRRLVVPRDTTMAQLHDVLQTAMGWLDGHLHQFVAGSTLIGPPDFDADPGQRDESTVRLDEVLRRAGDKLRYDYDFGDGWEHDVVLEAVEPEPVVTVTCTAGRRACPPEDCGGPWGYAELIAAVSDARHPEHAERMEWVGPYFDAAEFDRAEVNRLLAGGL